MYVKILGLCGYVPTYFVYLDVGTCMQLFVFNIIQMSRYTKNIGK